jgi:hypothetical protein
MGNGWGQDAYLDRQPYFRDYPQRHFIDRMLDGKPFETNGREYLKTLAVQEAVYESASKNATISVGQ